MAKTEQVHSNPGDENPDASVEQEQTFVSHLYELRDRLIQVVLVFLVCFVISFFVWKDLYAFLSGMIETTVKIDGQLVEQDKWINISPAGGIFTAIKISMSAAFFIAMPFIFFQLWQFVAPGLYSHERKLVMPIILGGTILFYLGILFARFVILPIFFVFAETFIPPNTTNSYDILQYLNFTLSIFFAFGIAFQVPIVTIVLVWAGLSTPDNLIAKRPYVVVGVFIIGMLLTPPDVISQTLLAIPMWLLFELGVVLSRMYYSPSAEEDEPEQEVEDYSPATKSGASNFSASDVPQPQGKVWERKPKSDGGTDTQAPEDKPLTEADLDAELDRFDAEMDELERQQHGKSFTDTKIKIKVSQGKGKETGEDNETKNKNKTSDKSSPDKPEH